MSRLRDTRSVLDGGEHGAKLDQGGPGGDPDDA
jgi:hypothetical protein